MATCDEETRLHDRVGHEIGRRRLLALAVGTAGAVILAACGSDATPATSTAAPAATTAPSAAAATKPATSGSATAGTPATSASAVALSGLPTLAIEAFDYGFRSPVTSIPAGVTLVQMKNTGMEDHNGQIVRLNDGVTPDQFMAAVAKGEDAILAVGQYVGGPGPAIKDATVSVILNLTAGQHYVLSLIPSPSDGKPQFMKGSVMPLTVTAATGTVAMMPPTKGTVSMVDFGFKTDISTLPAGQTLLKVTNDGVQPHEMVIVRLAAGKTAGDVTQWASTHMGPPPYVRAGGIEGFAKGGSGIAVLDLTPGNYVAICNVTDPMTNKPHVLLGMIAGLTVM